MKWVSVTNETMQTPSRNDEKEDGGVVWEVATEATLHHRAVIFGRKMKYEGSGSRPAVSDALRYLI